jgi:hypothetical protein
MQAMGGMPKGPMMQMQGFGGPMPGSEFDVRFAQPMAPMGYGMPMGQMGQMGQMGMNPMGGYPSAGGYAPIRHGQQQKRPQICKFHLEPRGCVKGEMCDFVHQKQQPCRWFTSDRGCIKGEGCDFQHIADPSKKHRAQPY